MNKLAGPPLILISLLLATACDSHSSLPGEDRAATVSAAAPGPTGWTLVGLGDSFTATPNSSGRSYLDLFQESLQASAGRPITLKDLSSDTNTSSRLADVLRHDEATRSAVAGADIVLVSVGGNDSDPFGVYPPGTCSPRQAASACLKTYAPDFAKNYEVILSQIVALRSGRSTEIRVTSADNPFVWWSEAPSKSFGVQFYRQVADAETEVACTAASRYGGVCIDYLHLFGGADGTRDPARFLGQDHAHPGDAGIKAIARLLERAGVPELPTD